MNLSRQAVQKTAIPQSSVLDRMFNRVLAAWRAHYSAVVV